MYIIYIYIYPTEIGDFVMPHGTILWKFFESKVGMGDTHSEARSSRKQVLKPRKVIGKWEGKNIFSKTNKYQKIIWATRDILPTNRKSLQSVRYTFWGNIYPSNWPSLETDVLWNITKTRNSSAWYPFFCSHFGRQQAVDWPWIFSMKCRPIWSM